MKLSLPHFALLLLAPLVALGADDRIANDIALPAILAPDELTFVNKLATATLETCGVAPGAVVGGKTNTLGFRAFTPGGYPAESAGLRRECCPSDRRPKPSRRKGKEAGGGACVVRN